MPHTLYFCFKYALGQKYYAPIMAIATTEADEAVASSVFVQIMGTSLKKLLVRVILVISPRLILRSGYGDANSST